MPVYEYTCASCGDFTAMRPMRERDRPQACPGCAAPATRLILTAPASHVGDGGARKAQARNERAAHEPRRHPAGAGTEGVAAQREPAGPKYKRAGCGRPWMIGH
jgi:putative FmdB family regulatory protein